MAHKDHCELAGTPLDLYGDPLWYPLGIPCDPHDRDRRVDPLHGIICAVSRRCTYIGAKLQVSYMGMRAIEHMLYSIKHRLEYLG